MKQLGGDVVILSSQDSQLGRGEAFADTARVLSRYVDAIMLRTTDKQKLDEMAQHATVPVINGLTNLSHPCQIMADLMTFEEHRGPIAGRTIAWIGDGNNVCASFIHAAAKFDFRLVIACPDAYHPRPDDLAHAPGCVEITTDMRAAARGADAVVADGWVSMGDADHAARVAAFAPYQVDEALMALAAPDAVFLHCLPAHRGEEVTAGVIDGPQSLIWDEAENRIHAQKSILAWCFGAIR
jgi:ornithine carbamoyltransferase